MLIRPALLATAVLLALPAVAGATDFYVDAASGTNGGGSSSCNDPAAPCQTLQYTLDEAAQFHTNTPHTIHVAPTAIYHGSFHVGNGSFYTSLQGATIDGSWMGTGGARAQILHDANDSLDTFDLDQPDMTLENVQIQQNEANEYALEVGGQGDIVRNAFVFAQNTGTDVSAGEIAGKDDTFDGDDFQTNGTGAALRADTQTSGTMVKGSRIERGGVADNEDQPLLKVQGGVHVIATHIDDHATSARSAVGFTAPGPVGTPQYTAVFDDDLITGGDHSMELNDLGGVPNSPTITVRESTLDAYGQGFDSTSGGSQSIWSNLLRADSAPQVSVQSSILVDQPGGTATGQASVTCSNSVVPSATAGGCAVGTSGNVGFTDPLDVFVGPASAQGSEAFDWHLKAGSPAIDAGGAAALAADEPATDFDGHPRLASGTLRCDVKPRDAGAYEVQNDGTPPTVSVSGPASGLAAQPLTFTAAASGGSSPATTFAWSFGDGATATGATVTHAFATPGTRTVTVTASDGKGCGASASTTVATAPAKGVPTPPPPGGTTGAPKISGASVKGTKLRFRLNEGATVKIAWSYRPQGKHKRKRLKTLSVHGKAGANTVRLARRLKAGRYTLTLVATAAGHRSTAVKVTFKSRSR